MTDPSCTCNREEKSNESCVCSSAPVIKHQLFHLEGEFISWKTQA